jgi:hypothetical protein
MILLRELHEFRPGAPAVNGRARQLPAFGQRLRPARDKQRGGGIEQNRVAFRAALLAGQNFADDFGVDHFVAAKQVSQRRRLQEKRVR